MYFSFLFPEKTALRILVVSNIFPSERWPLESRDLLPCHSEHSCKYHLQRDTCKLESLTLQGSPRGRSGRPAFHLLAPIGEPRQRTCSLFPDGHGASERHGIYEEQLSCVWLEDTSCETLQRGWAWSLLRHPRWTAPGFGGSFLVYFCLIKQPWFYRNGIVGSTRDIKNPFYFLIFISSTCTDGIWSLKKQEGSFFIIFFFPLRQLIYYNIKEAWISVHALGPHVFILKQEPLFMWLLAVKH